MKASLAWTISAVSVSTRTTARRSLTTQSGSNVAFSTSARLMAPNATGVAQVPAADSSDVLAAESGALTPDPAARTMSRPPAEPPQPPRRVVGGQGGRPPGGPSEASLSLTPGQPPHSH